MSDDESPLVYAFLSETFFPCNYTVSLMLPITSALVKVCNYRTQNETSQNMEKFASLEEHNTAHTHQFTGNAVGRCVEMINEKNIW